MRYRGFVLIGGIAALTVLALSIITPLAFPYGHFTDLDGTPGIVDHGWSVTEGIYLLGDVLCHQQMDRSFILNGSQLPFCIRDVGLIAGLTAGMFACALMDRRMSDRRYGITGVLLMSVTGIEWIAQNFVASSDPIRFATGIISGFGTAMLLSWLLYRNE